MRMAIPQFMAVSIGEKIRENDDQSISIRFNRDINTTKKKEISLDQWDIPENIGL